jgi:tripartite-type tricarboxylate transporter receptor subunit TctC
MLKGRDTPAAQSACGFIAATLFAACCAAAAHAQPAAEFYRANGIRLVVAAGAGESYDAAGRLVARHLGKFLPGNPKIVVENMPGASGRVGANWAYTVAPKDGSLIIGLLQTNAMAQALGESGTRYDAAKFVFLGSPITPTDVFAVRKSAGVRTMEEARHKEVTIGSTAVTAQNYIFPALANHLLGTKFRIVTGYNGGNDINLAVERGEVHGRGAFPWGQLKATKPQWLATGEIVLLAQTGLVKDPDLPDVPRLVDLAGTDEARRIFEFLSLTAEIGRPYAFPPGAPQDRVDLMRAAFDTMMKDKEFLADGHHMMEEVIPKSGAEVESFVRRVLDYDRAAVDRFREILAGLQK